MNEEDPIPRDPFEDMPLYRKSLEILDIVDAICALVPEEDEMLSHIKSNIQIDAYTIPPKIAGAEAAELYDLRMENAAIIRKAARELITQTNGLRAYGFDAPEYFQLLRDEMEDFRLLFVDWVAGFDPWHYIIDRWGLFNPPGVSAHDKDPDDDIPFDPSDWLE